MRVGYVVFATLILAVAATLALAGGDPAPDPGTTDDGVWVDENPVRGKTDPPAGNLYDGVPVPEPSPDESVDSLGISRDGCSPVDMMSADERDALRHQWGIDELREQLREAKRAEVRERGGTPVRRPARKDYRWSSPVWPWDLSFHDAVSAHFWGWRGRSHYRPGYRGHGAYRPEYDRPLRQDPLGAVIDGRRTPARAPYAGPWPWDEEAPPTRDEATEDAKPSSSSLTL